MCRARSGPVLIQKLAHGNPKIQFLDQREASRHGRIEAGAGRMWGFVKGCNALFSAAFRDS